MKLNDILNWIQYLKSGEKEKLKLLPWLQEKRRPYENLRAVSYPMSLTPSRPVHSELEFCSPEYLQGFPVWYPFANVLNLFSIIQSLKSLLENFNYLRSQYRCLGNITQEDDSYLHLPARFSNPLHATLAAMSFKLDCFSSVP